MTITSTQITQARSIGFNLLQAVQAMDDFLGKVNDLEKNNWVQVIQVGGTPVNATVAPADQATLLATYAILKANLATLYSQLP